MSNSLRVNSKVGLLCAAMAVAGVGCLSEEAADIEQGMGINGGDQSAASSQPDKVASTDSAANGETPSKSNDETAALALFNRRILPIMQSEKPSSCAECHLSGVDLKDYIRADQKQTFAALRERGMIDVENPGDSKILRFIARAPKKSSLISSKVRQEELDAFLAWIVAAAQEPELLEATADGDLIGAKLPDEVIRHARNDRVLQSFIDNVWLERGRCAACHSPDRNQKQVQEHGEQVSWITLGDPQATLDYMVDAELIDIKNPDQSLLLLKPTLQVEHGGGQKMVVGDRTYKQFRRFIDDYAAVVNGRYQSADELPEPTAEISVSAEMWLKFTNVPRNFDKQLLQVDLYRETDGDWSEDRWASADRLIFGKGMLWQQHLSLTASRGSKRAAEIRKRRVLPPGRYLARVYIDRDGKLQKNPTAVLGDEDFIGQTVIDSRWPTGYGKMTIVDYQAMKSPTSDQP
jgi:hypothetical protein